MMEHDWIAVSDRDALQCRTCGETVGGDELIAKCPILSKMHGSETANAARRAIAKSQASLIAHERNRDCR